LEFTNINRKDILLISGAMSHSIEQADIVKLQGPLKVLERNGPVRMATKADRDQGVRTLIRIFDEPGDFMTTGSFKTPLITTLAQIYDSEHASRDTLGPQTVKNYLGNIDRNFNKCVKRNNVAVLWNGHMDRKILKQFIVRDQPFEFLNLTAYDQQNNGLFYLELTDLERERTIGTTFLGPVNKNGRMLNLTETHNLVCKNIHPQMTIAHDPITDVIMTKCIFNHIFRKIGRHTIITNFFCLKGLLTLKTQT
jgi:hypothetical protein